MCEMAGYRPAMCLRVVHDALRAQYMFYGASAFDQTLSAWNMSSVTEARDMFTGASSLSGCNQAAIYNSFSAQIPSIWDDQLSGFTCITPSPPPAPTAGDDPTFVGADNISYEASASPPTPLVPLRATPPEPAKAKSQLARPTSDVPPLSGTHRAHRSPHRYAASRAAPSTFPYAPLCPHTSFDTLPCRCVRRREPWHSFGFPLHIPTHDSTLPYSTGAG